MAGELPPGRARGDAGFERSPCGEGEREAPRCRGALWASAGEACMGRPLPSGRCSACRELVRGSGLGGGAGAANAGLGVPLTSSRVGGPAGE